MDHFCSVFPEKYQPLGPLFSSGWDLPVPTVMDSIYLTYLYHPMEKIKKNAQRRHACGTSICDVIVILKLHHHVASQHIQNFLEVSKGAKIRNRVQSSTTPDPGYQWVSDKLTADTTNESQEVSSFPAGDHKAHINRRAQRHSKHKTEQKHKRSTKEVPPFRFFI